MDETNQVGSDTRSVAQQDAAVLRTAGQRRVNLVWEITQSVIALGVSFTTLWVSVVLVTGETKDATALGLISNAFFLIIGFYFGRTNHQRTGGVGAGDLGR